MCSLDTRLGPCEVCGASPAKYTCPKCEVKTCGLVCVNIHKKELECDGVRDRVKYKPLAQFTNLDFLSDYRLLEEVTRHVDVYARDPRKNYSRCTKELPVQLFRLRAAAMVRGTRIHFLPKNFSRHGENTTYLDWKTQVISWRVEWLFPQAGAKYIDERVPEGERLCVLLAKFLEPSKCVPQLREPLQFYQSAGHSGIVVLLKAEHVRKSACMYYELDTSLTLKNAFKGKTIVEFPSMSVVLNSHRSAYQLADSDEEVDEADIGIFQYRSKFTASNQGPKGEKSSGGRGRKSSSNNNFLFNTSDSSDDGNSDGADAIGSGKDVYLGQ